MNLSICEKSRISINIPIEIQGFDKFNTSSEYFNDICYTTTSDSGTDISLKDRKILHWQWQYNMSRRLLFVQIWFWY